MSLKQLFDRDEPILDSSRLRESWTGANINPARSAYRARLRIWTLRILGGGAGLPTYCEVGHPRLSLLADLLEMPALADPASSVSEVQCAIKAALKLMNSPMTPIPEGQTAPVADCAMKNTIAWLGEQAGLDEVSSDIFELMAAMRVFWPLRLAVSTWGEMGHGELPYPPSAAPGTGKTAYAHALARMLDKPLLEQRASDLLSPWVGETEQRIRQAFDSAMLDDAVLFIDEVDSLLASRRQAVRNWEVSQVNELLEQLSEYEGIVVLATNRIDALDEAVLRRMDAKIRFDSLSPEQLRTSFKRLCAHIGVLPTQGQLTAASNLMGVTPGDFACLHRRLAFAPLKPGAAGVHPGEALFALLHEELQLQRRKTRGIGFHLPSEGY